MVNARFLLVCAAMLVGAAAPTRPPPGTPVMLRSQPGTPIDVAARKLVADDLAAARARGDKPLVLTGNGALGRGSDHPALFVQLQSEQECGSGGCSTTVYLWEHGGWTRVLDGVTGHLTIAAVQTKGRPDLIADDDHFVWTGSAYRSLHPAPSIDLRPHVRQR